MNPAKQAPMQTKAERLRCEISEVRVKNVRSGEKYYYSLRVDQTLKWTEEKVTAGINTEAVWYETRTFEAGVGAAMEIKVFLHHRILEDEEVGALKGSVGSLISSTGAITYDLVGLRDANMKGPPRITLTVRRTGSEDDPVEPSVLEQALREANQGGAQLKTPAILVQVGAAYNAVDSGITQVAALEDTWAPFLTGLQTFVNLMDNVTGVNVYANLAWSVISGAAKLFLKQTERDQSVLGLVKEMNKIYELLIHAKPLESISIHRDVLKRIFLQTIECGHFIKSYAKNPSFCGRFVAQLFSSHLDEKISGFKTSFIDLWDEFQKQSVMQTEISINQTAITVVRIVTDVQDLATEIQIRDIPHVGSAKYQPGKQCLADTRTQILDEICEWANNTVEDPRRVYFLSGPAGTGKSTIAYTVAARFDDMKRLGSSFCFSSSAQTVRRPELLIPTIARDLADFDTAFRAALWEEVGGRTSDRTTTDLKEQFDKFLLQPSKKLAISGPIFILIDGLDEIGDPTVREDILDLLSTRLGELPANFRILLTSRPEEDVIDFLEGQSKLEGQPNLIVTKRMPTPDQDATLTDDVFKYICVQLTDRRRQRLKGLDDDRCQKLTSMAEGVFQWAFLACKYIRGRVAGQTEEKRFEILVSGHRADSKNVFDDLYSKILTQQIKVENPDILDCFRSEMGFVLGVFEPLSKTSLLTLAGKLPPVEAPTLTDVLPFLGALLSGVTDNDVPVRPLHSSFREFLQSKERSGDFYIDLGQHQERLARASLGVLNDHKEGLRFNICNLETSYLLNRDVLNLAQRITDNISNALAYASKSWADHLPVEASNRGDLLNSVETLLLNGYLFWLEVLSLLGAVNTAEHSLSLASQWSSSWNSGLSEFAEDACRFVGVFRSVISDSAPHIYLSALMCAPPGSLVVQRFRPQYPHIASIRTGITEHWTPLQREIRVPVRHNSANSSITISPDGSRVVVWDVDYTVHVRDIETGRDITDPLILLTPFDWFTLSPDGKRVMCGSYYDSLHILDVDPPGYVEVCLGEEGDGRCRIAMSSHGQCIASGHFGGAIRLWNAQSGAPLLQLDGFSNDVECIAFSPDDKYLAAGSTGSSPIRIWNVKEGTRVAEPLQSQSRTELQNRTDFVDYLAYSPDGERLAFHSSAGICIWDTKTRFAVFCRGHHTGVGAIGFSPDGKLLASGSIEMTIRQWDSATGEPIGPPLCGHTAAITSVAFSGDGRRILSCSEDGVVRSWIVTHSHNTGVKTTASLNISNVVTVSRDGKRLAAASYDSTICVWDTDSCAVIGNLDGCTAETTTLTFSPSGHCIAAGCSDGAIHVWDTDTRRTVVGPLHGHANRVTAIDFSPADEKRLASGSYDGTVRIWDGSTGDSVVLEHGAEVYSVHFLHPRGARLVSASHKCICIWSPETGERIGEPIEVYYSWTPGISASPLCNRILTSLSVDNDQFNICTLDADTGKKDVIWSNPLGPIMSVAFVPRVSRVVCGFLEALFLIVIDAETGQEVGPRLEGHSGYVSCVITSDDGRLIVSGSADCTVRLWHAERRCPVCRPLRGHTAGIKSVTLLEDGKSVVSVSEDGDVRVWNVCLPGEQEDMSAYLTFSSRAEDSMSQPYEPLGMANFEEVATPKDGWIIGGEGDLLFWLQSEYIPRLWWPKTKGMLPGEGVTIDLSRFRHGTRWAECRQPLSA